MPTSSSMLGPHAGCLINLNYVKCLVKYPNKKTIEGNVHQATLSLIVIKTQLTSYACTSYIFFVENAK